MHQTYLSEQLTATEVWSPQVIEGLSNSQLRLYLEFSSSPCIRGGGCSTERALQVLYKEDGQIDKAMENLLSSGPRELGAWLENEFRAFERLIMIYGKNFYLISQEMKTKSVKECVEFYYLWKRSALRSPSINYRIMRDENNNNINRASPNSVETTNSSSNSSSLISLATTSSTTILAAAAAASSTTSSFATSDNNNNNNNNNSNSNGNCILFVCKVCGRPFEKIKSRSAHMKRHKNER